MTGECCRNCNNRDSFTGECSIIKEHFELNNNFESLVEGGNLRDYIQEMIPDLVKSRFKEFMKSKINQSEYEEAMNNFMDDIDEMIYNFFKSKLESTMSTSCSSEFKCGYYR